MPYDHRSAHVLPGPISPVLRDHPTVVLAGTLVDPDDPVDPMAFFERFGVDYTQTQAEGYEPLFLALTDSSSGEEAESFGLFRQPGARGPRLFEVSGTECSVWDFNGQWEPELTTPAALWRRLSVGQLGLRDGEQDVFRTTLQRLVVQLDPTVAQPEALPPGRKPGARTRR